MATIIELRTMYPTTGMEGLVIDIGHDVNGWYLIIDSGLGVAHLFDGYYVTVWVENTPADGVRTLPVLEITEHTYDGIEERLYVGAYNLQDAMTALLESLKGATPGGYVIPGIWKYRIEVQRERNLHVVASHLFKDSAGIRNVICFGPNGEMIIPYIEFSHLADSIKDQLAAMIDDGYIVVKSVDTISLIGTILTSDQVRTYTAP